jgi:hypothetical protein
MVLPSLFLGTEKIPWCDAVTDLGVVINGRLRFDRQCSKECSRVLRFLTPFLVISLLTLLVRVLLELS